MKRTISFILFAVIAVAVIWIGVWYDKQLSDQASQSELAQGQAAQETQQKIMAELNIKDNIVGTGAEAKSGDAVSVLYTGKLDDGTVFDASSLHGNQPFSFVIGASGPGSVIQGWNLGVVGMKVGGTRELTIPPELGYGASPNGPIPANATLHFTIQLLSVTSTSAGQ
jgi:FKBP-type peptidyl-prolyl cis-trans isomerase FkpA